MEQPKEYTPEEKAELTNQRVVSDAEYINDGVAKFVPDSNGEPTKFELGKPRQFRESENRMVADAKELMFRETNPDAKKLVKLGHLLQQGLKKKDNEVPGQYIENPNQEYFESWESNLLKGGVEIWGTEYNNDERDMTTVELDNRFSDRRPRFVIRKTRLAKPQSNVWLRNQRDLYSYNEFSSVRYAYSFQEYYDKLLPEEREKGEVLGKKMESLLEE